MSNFVSFCFIGVTTVVVLLNLIEFNSVMAIKPPAILDPNYNHSSINSITIVPNIDEFRMNNPDLKLIPFRKTQSKSSSKLLITYEIGNRVVGKNPYFYSLPYIQGNSIKTNNIFSLFLIINIII